MPSKKKQRPSASQNFPQSPSSSRSWHSSSNASRPSSLDEALLPPVVPTMEPLDEESAEQMAASMPPLNGDPWRSAPQLSGSYIPGSGRRSSYEYGSDPVISSPSSSSNYKRRMKVSASDMSDDWAGDYGNSQEIRSPGRSRWLEEDGEAAKVPMKPKEKKEFPPNPKWEQNSPEGHAPGSIEHEVWVLRDEMALRDIERENYEAKVTSLENSVQAYRDAHQKSLSQYNQLRIDTQSIGTFDYVQRLELLRQQVKTLEAEASGEAAEKLRDHLSEFRCRLDDYRCVAPAPVPGSSLQVAADNLYAMLNPGSYQ
jgi:hypothetical protein